MSALAVKQKCIVMAPLAVKGTKLGDEERQDWLSGKEDMKAHLARYACMFLFFLCI